MAKKPAKFKVPVLKPMQNIKQAKREAAKYEAPAAKKVSVMTVKKPEPCAFCGREYIGGACSEAYYKQCLNWQKKQ